MRMPPHVSMQADRLPQRPPRKSWSRLKAIVAPAKSPPNHALLTGWDLGLAVVALNFVNGVAFVDILGIGVIQSAVSDHYNGHDAVDWNTTSALIGAAVGQCILGYMSDVFTRRKMLLFAVALLFLGALGCASSASTSHAELLVLCRAICGVAVGSISNLVNISQNDICTEEQRLNLQGVQGTSVALGSIIGSLAAALLPHWRQLYFLEAALALVAIFAIYKFLPPNRDMPARSEIRKEVGRIDYLGILTGMGWLIPGLILLSKWRKFDTPVLVALSVVATLSAVLFGMLGSRTELADDQPKPPGLLRKLTCRRSRAIAPFRLFKNRTVAAIYAQNVLFGAAFYSFVYFVPVQAQVVRQEPALTGVYKLIPYFVTHAVWSTVSARVIKVFQSKGWVSYSVVMGFGFCCWTIAMALLGWDCTQPDFSHFYGFAVLVGFGTGSVFQNSVLAITKQVMSDDKAVALGTRNVLRFVGGAIGTGLSSMTMRTVVRHELPDRLDHVADSAVADHSYIKNLPEVDRALVRAANARGIAIVWYTFAGVLGLCAILCVLIKDRVAKKEEDEEKILRPGSSDSPIQPAPLDDEKSRPGSGNASMLSTPLPAYLGRNGSEDSVQRAHPAAPSVHSTPLGWL